MIAITHQRDGTHKSGYFGRTETQGSLQFRERGRSSAEGDGIAQTILLAIPTALSGIPARREGNFLACH